jgi:hypothetical protein
MAGAKTVAALAVAAALAAAACGSGSSATATATATSNDSGYNRPERAKYTEEQVAAALGLKRNEVGDWDDPREQCSAPVIFTAPDQMRIYIDAGDAVTTNPSGQVGAKVVPYQGVDAQMCFDRFQAALKSLR